MKVYLDDERNTPEGWIRVYWPDEAIALLTTGKVLEISLDHDLGNDERGTRYDVILWIEEATALHAFNPPDYSRSFRQQFSSRKDEIRDCGDQQVSR